MAVSCESLPPDEEPKLKYDRLENDGIQWGVIHLLDHEGNTVPISQDGKTKELQAHKIAVNRISVDLKGDYIASCSL